MEKITRLRPNSSGNSQGKSRNSSETLIKGDRRIEEVVG